MGEHATCTDTLGSYACACKEGYELENKTGKRDKGGGKCRLIPVDECETGAHDWYDPLFRFRLIVNQVMRMQTVSTQRSRTSASVKKVSSELYRYLITIVCTRH